MKKLLPLLLSAAVILFAFACKDKELPAGDQALTLSPATPIEFPATGGSKVITVTTTLSSWNVASSQAWCTVSKTTATTFTITALANASTDAPAAATVTVTAGSGDMIKTAQIAVTQLGVGGAAFEIKLANLSKTGVDLEIVPKSKTDTYYYDVLAKKDLAEYHGDNLSTYIDNMINQAIELNDGNLEAALKAVVTIGDDKYSTTSLVPNVDYIAFAVGLDAKGKPSTAFVEVPFKTLDNSVNMTFAINDVKRYFDGFDFTITPSDLEQTYYYTIRTAREYQGMDDAALLAKIIEEDSFMIDMRAASGAQTYENENVYSTGTDHIVVAFGWADGVATTPLKKFTITTEDVDVPTGANFQFKTDTITSRSAAVTVTPSVDKAMYLFDIMDEASYDKYKDNLEAYVDAYVAEIYIDLDYQLYRGEGLYTYDKVLKSGSKYYVWAAYIDQAGKVRGKVMLSDPFVTLQAQVSTAAVTSSIEKYFNGDDLFAKDPIKYADLKGKAYAAIKFTQNEDAKLWYAVMVEEDPADPTSAIDDAKMAASLEGGAGIWCSVGKVYICNWDMDHTALGVAVGADQNYGPVMRDKYKFTKAGASPIGEFVEPVSAPAAVSKSFDKTKAAGVKVFKTAKPKAAKTTQKR